MAKSTKQFADMGAQELTSTLSELKFDLMKLNAQRSSAANLKNPKEINKIKKNIARIETLLANKK